MAGRVVSGGGGEVGEGSEFWGPAIAGPGLEMATGTRNPSTRRVLPDKEAGME
jgi:hypothetical protein